MSLSLKEAAALIAANEIGADLADQRFRVGFPDWNEWIGTYKLRLLLIADVVECAINRDLGVSQAWDRVIQGVTLRPGRDVWADGATVDDYDFLQSYAYALQAGANRAAVESDKSVFDDAEALDLIAEGLRTPEWTGGTIEAVAEVVGTVRNLDALNYFDDDDNDRRQANEMPDRPLVPGSDWNVT